MKHQGIAAALSLMWTAASLTAEAQVLLPEWAMTSNMSSPRLSATATPLQDGRVLVAGGADDGGPLTSAEVFDPGNGQWTPTGSMGTPRIAFSAVRLVDGRVLVVGGCDCPAAEIYDPGTGVWSPAANTSGNKGREGQAATLLSDGRVLLVQGLQPELYDPGTNQWTPTAPMVSPGRIGHSVTRLPNGHVLVASGSCGSISEPV